MNPFDIKKLGPLAALAGIWEGDKGDDTAPSDDRGTEKNLFRERMTFEPMGPINNHEQELYGLRYTTTAWRLGIDSSFHEEIGYWLWDAKEQQVMRCFMIPRGVTLIAGGKAKATDKKFKLSAKLGSDTYGICSNKFLNREFKTTQYELTITMKDAKTFTYEQDTVLKIKGKKQAFHHIDKNTMRKVS